MYNSIGINANKRVNELRRRFRRHKTTNREFYIYSYDGEKTYNTDEDDYDDMNSASNKEEWDEYPEIEDINENEIDDDKAVYDEDGELWERYDGNSNYDSDNNAEDDYEVQNEYINDDDGYCELPCDYEVTIDVRKVLFASIGVVAGALAIYSLLKRKR